MRISFNCAAEFYDATRGLPEYAMKQLVRTLISELKDYGTILDVGVGTGRFAKPFQSHGLNAVGIDIAEKMLEKAKEKGARDLLRSDACFLPFIDGAFDASVCIHLLHLISDWRMALLEICRVTKEVMLSMIYTTKNPVRQAYNQILENYGYSQHRLGKGEWELKETVEPVKSLFAATFDNSADELINHLSKRAYSSQWKIPENVNKKAVDDLRKSFGGKTFPTQLRVLVWSIEDIKAYLSTFKSACSNVRTVCSKA
jgi:ubiquinone/menaquinone biosynthesis C-methylase UbiE